MSTPPEVTSKQILHIEKFLEKYKKTPKNRRRNLGGEGKKTQAEAELKTLKESMVQATVVGDTVNMDVDMPLSPSFKGVAFSRGDSEGRDEVGTKAGPSLEPDMDVDGDKRTGIADPIDIKTFADKIPFGTVRKFIEIWNEEHKFIDVSPLDHHKVQGITTAFKNLHDAALALAKANNVALEDMQWPSVDVSPKITIPVVKAAREWLAVNLVLPEMELKPKGSNAGKRKASRSEEIHSIYDYKKGMEVKFTQSMMEEARTTLDAWMGSIEDGTQTALHVLRNRNGFQKCLACHNGARGATKPKKGDLLKGSGPKFMAHCGCPLETALIELFITKVTAGNGLPVPSKKGCDGAAKPSEFYFNPVNLTVVGSAIEILSGHKVATLFTPEAVRLEKTVVWALDRLAGEHISREDEQAEMRELAKRVKELIRNNGTFGRKGTDGETQGNEANEDSNDL